MQTEEIATELEKLGIPSPQSQAYVLLARAGSTRAGVLARELGLSRPRTYRMLEEMARQGLVEVSLTRPFQYSARDPRSVLEKLSAEAESRVAMFEQARPRLVGALDSLRGKTPLEKPRERLEVVQGHTENVRAVGKLMDDAKKVVRAVSTLEGAFARGEEQGLANMARRRGAEGIEFRVLLGEASREDLPRIRDYAKQNPKAAIRIVAGLPPMRLAIRDDEELLMSAIIDHRDDEIGIRSNAPALVRSQLALFERLWEEAQPVKPEP